MAPRYYDWIAHHAARQLEATAALDLASGGCLTYRAFDRRIAALAGHLRDTCLTGRFNSAIFALATA